MLPLRGRCGLAMEVSVLLRKLAAGAANGSASRAWVNVSALMSTAGTHWREAQFGLIDKLSGSHQRERQNAPASTLARPRLVETKVGLSMSI